MLSAAQRPGTTFALGAIAVWLGLEMNLNGWLIFALVVAGGWALNEAERRDRERA
jgi:hypothetical protein